MYFVKLAVEMRSCRKPPSGSVRIAPSRAIVQILNSLSYRLLHSLLETELSTHKGSLETGTILIPLLQMMVRGGKWSGMVRISDSGSKGSVVKPSGTPRSFNGSSGEAKILNINAKYPSGSINPTSPMLTPSSRCLAGLGLWIPYTFQGAHPFPEENRERV